jgi:hypothetical protein
LTKKRCKPGRKRPGGQGYQQYELDKGQSKKRCGTSDPAKANLEEPEDEKVFDQKKEVNQGASALAAKITDNMN